MIATPEVQWMGICPELVLTLGAGAVLRQSPAAGTIVTGGTGVDLVIGRVQVPVKMRVPNVVGLRHDGDAVGKRLAVAGLKLGGVTFAAGEVGVVLSQKPAPRALADRGSAVDIVVGRKGRVPNVVGMTLGRASAAIRKAGLTTGKVTYGPGEKPGEVLRQKPAAGTTVEPASSVQLLVVRGGAAPDKPDKPGEKPAEEKPETVKVPDVVGLSLGRARAELRKARLTLGKVSERPVRNAKKNRVASQSPRAGTSAPKGSSVSLVIAR